MRFRHGASPGRNDRCRYLSRARFAELTGYPDRDADEKHDADKEWIVSTGLLLTENDTGFMQPTHDDKARQEKDFAAVQLDEFKKLFETSLKLVQQARRPEEVFDKLLAEYERRFIEIPEVRLTNDADLDEASRAKIQALMLFARLAESLKENADVQLQLKQRSEKLDRLMQRLRKTNRELRRLNAHYLDMMGFVSHELRSPLISILGFAELLDEGYLGELNMEQQNSVQIIMRVTSNLIDMIKNYLDLAKIENGELAVNWMPIDLHTDVIKPTITQLESQLFTRGMQIETRNERIPENIIVEGDPDLLKVVFMNIFSNAIKYGRPDTTIYYHVLDVLDRFYFSITNEGEGVSPEHIEKIFNKFTQGEYHDPDAPRGTGLGLYNTRCIVEAHGGTIWAESEQGNWFKICFTLPKKQERRTGQVKIKSALPSAAD